MRRAFLQTVYGDSDTNLTGDPSYFYSYEHFLPTKIRFGENGPRIGCVRADALSKAIGLNELWLLLSCYAPEYGATLVTTTFKELEALGVFARVQEQTSKTLIVSSAGNAARAFLEIGAKYGLPAIVLVPESALPGLYVSTPSDTSGPVLIALRKAYYPDAIRVVEEIQNRFSDELVREGGCYNVARRDSIGILLHRAVRTIGRIPQHYVQAVGSGTGAIAAWEATRRIGASGEFGQPTMRLHLVQNFPFTPMVDAWRAKKKHVDPISRDDLNQMLSQTYSKVLSNANPPYSVAGGVYDALSSTDGDMYAVSNREAMEAREVFMKHIDIVPCPEASVSLAGLRQAIHQGYIAPSDPVLLHVTGGGWSRCVAEFCQKPYPVALRVAPSETSRVMSFVEKYLDRASLDGR
jgi:cysteate synthase